MSSISNLFLRHLLKKDTQLTEGCLFGAPHGENNQNGNISKYANNAYRPYHICIDDMFDKDPLF